MDLGRGIRALTPRAREVPSTARRSKASYGTRLTLRRRYRGPLAGCFSTIRALVLPGIFLERAKLFCAAATACTISMMSKTCKTALTASFADRFHLLRCGAQRSPRLAPALVP